MVLERSSSPGVSASVSAPRWQRLHALCGALPLGAFVLLHLLEQSAALGGPEAHVRRSPSLGSAAALALEIAFVYLPLSFHAGYGVLVSLARARDARERARAGASPGLARRAIDRRTLQLATGLVVGAFLLAHLWQFRVRTWLGELEPGDFFDELCASLSGTVMGGVPLTALGYVIALGAVAFHFASGLHGACRTWGIALSERAARATTGLFVAVGVGLFVLGAITVIYLATGSVSLPSAG